MKKSMCLVLCLAVLLPFLPGCGTKASDGDGFGVIHLNQTSKPIDSENTLTAGLFKRLDSGVYHMHMVIKEGDSDATEIHCYAKDGNAVLAMETDVMGPMRIIYKNGEAYMLMDELKMGYVIEYDLDEDAPFLANTSNLTYVGAGSGEFADKTYRYDEYTNTEGSRLLYYVDDGELKGIRKIDQDGTVSDTEMLAFDKEIPDHIFDIPKDYEIIAGDSDDTDPTDPTEPTGATEPTEPTKPEPTEPPPKPTEPPTQKPTEPPPKPTEPPPKPTEPPTQKPTEPPPKPTEPPTQKPTEPPPKPTEPPAPTNTLTAELLKTINSGTFHIKAKGITGDMAGYELDIYAKNNMTAIFMQEDGVSFRIVAKNGKLYTILDDYQLMTVEDDTDGDLINFGGASELNFVGTGSGSFHGKTYSYDEYKDGEGTRYFYYVEGGSWKGVRVIEGGVTEDVAILAFDKNVADSVFTIPSNYETY